MDPFQVQALMADQLIRELTIGAIRLIPLACLIVPLAYLHAQWSRKR